MKQILIGLGITTGLATLTTVGLVLFDYPVLGAITGTATVAMWLVLFAICIVAVTSWWTRTTMAMGADIALKAQTVNDAWDARKTSAFVNLAKALLKTQSSQYPALPLPSRESWLPELNEFSEGDFEEVGHDR